MVSFHQWMLNSRSPLIRVVLSTRVLGATGKHVVARHRPNPMITTMSDATKMFLMSVVPSIGIVVALSLSFWAGRIPARNLVVALIGLASLWLVAFIWGYVDWAIRKRRRGKKDVLNGQSATAQAAGTDTSDQKLVNHNSNP